MPEATLKFWEVKAVFLWVQQKIINKIIIRRKTNKSKKMRNAAFATK